MLIRILRYDRRARRRLRGAAPLARRGPRRRVATLKLHALPELGVASISLAYTEAREADRHGNSFRYKAAVYGTPGSPVGMTAWDVWLVGVRPEPVASFREADTGNPKELGATGQPKATITLGVNTV